MATVSLVPETLFGQQAVIQLRESDFQLSSEAMITLKNKSCVLILFYGSNVESINLAKIWAIVASQIAGPIFAAVNLTYEKGIAEAFTKLHQLNSPLRWASLKGIPCILVYQNGWPIGFYNGQRSVQSIIDYSLTLACRPDYIEPIQYAASYTAPENFAMTGWNQYNENLKLSTDYNGQQNIRGYVPSDLTLIQPQTQSPTTPATNIPVNNNPILGSPST